MPPTTLSTVVLSAKGDPRKANLSLVEDGELCIGSIQKYFKKKEEPDAVATYTYEAVTLTLFGYKKGKKGTENKTEFPFPHSDLALYGDVIVVASLVAWEQPIPFTVEQWQQFEQRKEKDEDDEDDEEEEEEEEKSVKDDFEDSDADVEALDEDAEVEVDGDADVDADVEIEPEVVTKRKRAPVYQKVDTSALKEDILIDSPVDSHPIRMLCLKSLSFLEEESFSKEEITSLEKAIFESAFVRAQHNYIPRNWKSPTFCEAYRQIVRSVFSNLHPKSPVNNPRLLPRIRAGELVLSQVPFMTSYEMYPENWFALKDKLLQREQKILEGNKSRATDQFKCRRCQKRECTYYELQTRSADEPMTIFITCLNCGKEWRQGG